MLGYMLQCLNIKFMVFFSYGISLGLFLFTVFFILPVNRHHTFTGYGNDNNKEIERLGRFEFRGGSKRGATITFSRVLLLNSVLTDS